MIIILALLLFKIIENILRNKIQHTFPVEMQYEKSTSAKKLADLNMSEVNWANNELWKSNQK